MTYDAHLWIVLSKPELDPDRVLIVNLTSWREDKDQACMSEPADHPYVSRRSCVNYRASKIADGAQIERLVQSGRLEKHVPVDMPLLERIREGAMRSRFMPLDHARLLIDQGLVEP
jgi:hypothetical protein